MDGTHVEANTATVYLSWVLSSRDDVGYYDLFRVAGGANAKGSAPDGYGNPTREWLGRIFGDAFVVPDLKRHGSETETSIELVAVSPLGVTSPPARTTFNWTK